MAGFDYNILRRAEPKNWAHHLRTLALDGIDTDIITQEISEAAGTESVSPHVFSLWITACPDLSALRAGLVQMVSVSARSSAIKTFGRLFRKGRHAALWQAFGGAEGIVALMAAWSVNEVSTFCRVVGQCSTAGGARHERQGLVTDLVKALTPTLFSGATAAELDGRPLVAEYSRLVYACTPDFIDSWRNQKGLPDLDTTKLVLADPWLARERCLAEVANDDYDLSKFMPLFVSVPAATDAHEVSVSEPSAFSLRLVDILSAKEQLNLRKQGTGLVLETLLKRSARRRTSTKFAATAVNAIASCLRKHRASQGPYRIEYRGHLDDIVRLWHRDPSRFQPDLTQILRFVHPLSDITACVSAACQTERYPLLRWLVRDLHRSHVDIDDIESLRKDSTLRLASTTIYSLPRQEARLLLDRLTRARPDGGFLADASAGKHPDNGMDVGVSLLVFNLRDDRTAVAEEARRETGRCRRHAETSRDQNLRASLAKMTLTFAFASEDFAFISEMLIWARRYNRDPLTLATLYGDGGVLRPEAIQLLSGLLLDRTKDLSVQHISENVEHGNRVALQLFETMAMCQREPSFAIRSFNGVLGLFSSIASTRFARAEETQKWLNVDDSITYELINKPTIELLLRAERLVFDPDNKALQQRVSPAGLLATSSGTSFCQWDLGIIKRPSTLLLRFLDELMQRRNELWRELRASEHPAASGLSTPWTKGLPIQAFHENGSAGFTNSQYRRGWLPYLDRRAEAVVFMPGEAAMKPLTEDGDLRAAIGGFIDDYALALAIYTAPSASDNGEGRSERINKAWRHALNELSGSRMTTLEANLYWQEVFDNAGIEDVSVELPTRPLPSLPMSDEPPEISEWNPDPNPKESAIDERALEPVCIDVLTSGLPNVYGLSLDSDFPVHINPVVPGLPQPGFWLASQPRSVRAKAVKDAYVAAALFFFEGRAATGSSILSAPYPNARDVRFPALYLDVDFLDRKEHVDWAVLSTLQHHLRDVPPALLKRLVLVLLKKLEAKPRNEHSVRRWCFELLKLLAWSDKPQLALDVIADVVVSMPDESSWHRELLHHGILKRLPAQHAEALMTGLRDKILESLDKRARMLEDANRAIAASEEGVVESAPSKPTVKVTTVKMLAQMLNGASFIDEGRSVNILIAMFERATHPDIRVAIVESVVSMLWNTKDADLRDVIVSVLEQHAVPLAGDVNERSPMSEERWREAEDKLELPETYMQGHPRAIPPICNALISLDTGLADDEAKGIRDELSARLSITVIKRSIESNKRWTKIFLRKYGVEHLESLLPEVPVRPHLLLSLFRNQPHRIPRMLFQTLSSWILLHQDLPQALVDFNTRLTKDDSVRNTNEEKQWRAVWGKDALSMHDALIPQALQQNDWPSMDLEVSLTLGDIWAHERKMINTLLHVYDSWPGMYDDYFKRHRQNPQRSTKEHLERWQRNSKPMIEYMINRVNSLRTPEWQRDPDRQPAILPDTFPMRLWLLQHPICQKNPAHNQHVSGFAEHIRAIIDNELVIDHRPYQAHFARVEEAAQVAWQKDYCRIGVIIGDVESADAHVVTDLLRVQLAKLLLEKARKPDNLDDIAEVKDMLSRWRQSMDEDVRRAGLAITKHLESRANVKDDRSLFWDWRAEA